MARCQCGVELSGRRRKCDACKERPGQTETAEVVVEADSTPAGLHDRGRALWSVLGQDIRTPAGQIALEACRAADRLDELDSVIAGKGVLNLMTFRLQLGLEDAASEDTNVNVTVGFQNVLAEARQQQAGFRALLAELKDAVPATAPAAQPTAPAKTALDQLSERRAKKQR